MIQTFWKTRARRLWSHWIKPVATVVVVLSTFRSAVADWNVVPTGSMKPTILEGDRIFVNKLAYDLKLPFTQLRLATWGEPKRGDVVVLYSPADGTRLVKRVIGVPGDSVELRRNRLYLNGHQASYEPLEQATIDHVATKRLHQFYRESIGDCSHPVMLTPGSASPQTVSPFVVPPGHFFVMGDNRDQSGDSRAFGFVSRSQIVGRASLVVLSLDWDHHGSPRWDRFLRELP